MQPHLVTGLECSSRQDCGTVLCGWVAALYWLYPR